MRIKINCSDLPEAEKCLRRFFANNIPDYVNSLGYMLRKPQSTGVKLVVSSVVKTTIQDMFYQKFKKGNINIQESYGMIESELDRHQEESGKIEYDRSVSSKDNAREICRKMVARFKYDFAGSFSFPAKSKIEDIINVEIEANYGSMRLSGKIPVLTAEDIIMYKFSNKYSQSQHVQLGGYNLLHNSIEQHREVGNKVVNVPLVEVTKVQPKIEIYNFDSNYNRSCARNLLSNIHTVIDDVEETEDIEVIPCNPHFYLCSEKYCNAFKTSFCKRHR